MKIIRIILFPIVPIYYVVTWLRNWLYDIGVKPSKSYDFPVICIGNLSTGGTGKTPMIEYLIRLLEGDKAIATLSRGYKRKTEGFILADAHANTDVIGDEPFQFFRKFKSIKVAVDGDRQNGIHQLMMTKPKPDVILLDDAYQHRKVEAGFSILLTAYDNLYYKDFVLPTGNLREPRFGSKRADLVVVTKCKKDITEVEKHNIIKGLRLKPYQKVFFSHIDYAKEVISANNTLKLTKLPKFTLVTGIANATPLLNYLTNLGLKFNHLEYTDHYNYRASDIEMLAEKEIILTTEKDYVRLIDDECLKDNLYYLPIHLKIDKEDAFNNAVKSFVD